jgi:hypothetical protein
VALLRAHRGDGRVSRIDGEQGPQIRRNAGELLAEGGNAALDLLDMAAPESRSSIENRRRNRSMSGWNAMERPKDRHCPWSHPARSPI